MNATECNEVHECKHKIPGKSLFKKVASMDWVHATRTVEWISHIYCQKNYPCGIIFNNCMANFDIDANSVPLDAPIVQCPS